MALHLFIISNLLCFEKFCPAERFADLFFPLSGQQYIKLLNKFKRSTGPALFDLMCNYPAIDLFNLSGLLHGGAKAEITVSARHFWGGHAC